MGVQETTMSRVLLLLLAGAIPVFSQYNQEQQPRYNFGDYGHYDTNQEQQSGSDFGLQQPSFFSSFGEKTNNDNHQNPSVSSLIGGSYGGLTPPPPPESSSQVNNVNEYFASERHAIVPSSLRELEESYIRSLSPPSVAGKNSNIGPFGENRYQDQQYEQKSQNDGLENFSGFIMTRRHYNKNDHIRSSHHQQQTSPNSKSQSAPITYGFPLLNQQTSASNSIDTTFGRKEKKNFHRSHKNIVPNFPDFSDRPPVPEEPEIPSEEEEVEEATRKPPETFVLPTPADLESFSGRPIASPPPIFDPSFPDPIMQRGFIPSFGPPTKTPLFHVNTEKNQLLHQHELLHNHITSQVEVSTTSPVPVLRPEYSAEKETDVLPDELSSGPSSTDKPKEGTVYKHISIHVPPEDLDEELSAPKVIKVAKKPEKHIKVIFIKPPDSPAQKTEVEVPAAPQQKTLVYVLSESGGTRTPIKLVTPTPLKPAPPQVFFLRYTDPRNGVSPPTPSSIDDEETSGDDDGEEVTTKSPPPIKQLASPFDLDSDLLRSAPSPVLPTFPTGFSSPASEIAHQLSIQSSLASPTLFTNTKYENFLSDPTNSKYHGASLSHTNNLISEHSINNNRLAAFHSSSPQSHYNNPYNRYSSLYHLYPPPPNALNNVPKQDLLSLYINNQNSNNNYPHSHYSQAHSPSPFYRVGPSKKEPTTSSIQGLYTVAAPNLEKLAGINFNSLVQNPDGKNLPRSTRNFLMMNYAPTYMPSASGSDHAPVFTSPADFIKSLLGDSYMYYHNIANNSSLLHSIDQNLHQHQQQQQPETPNPTFATTTTTSTTPKPKNVKYAGQTQAQHHTIPLIFNWPHLQNLSSFQIFPNDSQQPLTLVIGNSFGGADSNNNHNAHLQLDNAKPVYPHLRPLFTYSSTTTTAKPQPRIAWSPSTTPSPQHYTPTTSATPKPFRLPIIVLGREEDSDHQSIINADSLSSHLNNIFHIHSLKQHGSKNATWNGDADDGEHSLEYSHSGSSSESYENSESGEESTEGESQQESDEELASLYYEPVRLNSTSSTGSNHNSSIVFVNSKKNSSSGNGDDDKNNTKANNNSTIPKRRNGRNRKRVNPAHVKPGRRLRKVRKPNKRKKSKSKGNDEREKVQSSAGS